MATPTAFIGSTIRHEWYTTPSDVVVTVFIKTHNVQKDLVKVDMEAQAIKVTYPALELNLDNLYEPIDVTNSTQRIVQLSPSHLKVELTLRKSHLGTSWPELQRHPSAFSSTSSSSSSASVGDDSEENSDDDSSEGESDDQGELPNVTHPYPSNRRTVTNWDALANSELARLELEEQKGKEAHHSDQAKSWEALYEANKVEQHRLKVRAQEASDDPDGKKKKLKKGGHRRHRFSKRGQKQSQAPEGEGPGEEEDEGEGGAEEDAQAGKEEEPEEIQS